MYILTVTKTKPYRAVLSRLWDFVTNSDLMVGSTHSLLSHHWILDMNITLIAMTLVQLNQFSFI